MGFQSALPLRGATVYGQRAAGRPDISIRAPLAGSDIYILTRLLIISIFQSALPLRGATCPCPPPGRPPPYFNPRSPCGERRMCWAVEASMSEFQSALPLRGATTSVTPMRLACIYFNPRSPCGERPPRRLRGTQARNFNPRSPCGERQGSVNAMKAAWEFQSALPLRGATRPAGHPRPPGRISIRAPLAGSDYDYGNADEEKLEFQSALPLRGATSRRAPMSLRTGYFNPRSPCGERPLHFVASIYYQQSVVFSKTVAANSVDKLRKTTAKSAITGCEPPS